MASQHLEDRLAAHIDSLQEGFELLTKASSLNEMARQFYHFLHGNLQSTDIHIFHKQKSSDQWQQLHGTLNDVTEYLDDASAGFVLRSFGGKAPRLSVLRPLADASLVGVVLGKKFDGSAYSRLDKTSLQMFLQLFANAYQANRQRRREKDLNFSLNHRLLQLNSLIDTGIELTSHESRTPPHLLALERAASLTNASWGRFKKTSRKDVLESETFPSGTKAHRVKEKHHRINTRFKFQNHAYTFELFEKESRDGTVAFEETDQLLLDAVARQVHAVFESQFLHKQELEKQKIEQDISVAAAIQQRILPATLPSIEGYATFGMNFPTKLVGGDYYDCVPLSDGRFAFIMADVAGKGIPAALLVSSFHASLNAFLESQLSLTQLAHKLNAAMYRASTEERYITALIAILTPQSGQIELLNAGHNAAYLLRADGNVVELSNGGIALGMLDMDFPYPTDSITLASGDRLLLYTDGITEAMNAKQEQYDNLRPLKNFFEQKRNLDAEPFVKELINDVRDHVGSAPQSDDITAMIIIRR